MAVCVWLCVGVSSCVCLYTYYPLQTNQDPRQIWLGNSLADNQSDPFDLKMKNEAASDYPAGGACLETSSASTKPAWQVGTKVPQAAPATNLAYT